MSLVNMTSDEKIAELKCIVSKIKQQNRLKFVGIVFSPLIIGIFLIRSATKKKTELINLKDNILDEVENETKIRINELICTYDSINDTFFIYRKKAELVGKCDLYLTYLQFFKKNKMLFNDNFNSFISESISIIVLLKDNFENYDNSYFIEKRILEYDYLFKKSPFPLDDSQKVSVITDDTHNLVVAGAGSGKTEVLITRIAYLIDRKPDTIDCEKILILAFQNKAAREIHDRLDTRFGFDVKVKTFHSFGLEILREVFKKVPTIADETEQRNLVLSIFNDEKKNNKFQNEIVNYMKTYGDSEIYKSKSDFDEKEVYYEYMRNLTYTALDGTKVKSEAEREILNFFITHNLNGRRVKVLYENLAKWMEYNKENGDTQIPKPDFFFPEYNIYLEHWAIDENGNVPEWFEGQNPAKTYKEGMDKKKKKFAEQEKYLLVETTHKDFKHDNFIQILETKILNALNALNEKNTEKSFEFIPISYDKLVNRVWKECVVSVKKLPYDIGSFITIAKTYNLSPAEVEQRINSELWSPKQREFANIALKIYSIYEDKLRYENKIDYSDMINLAVKNLKQKENLYKNSFDHILIDEYQDISSQRYDLINSLMAKNDNCKLFCVGDDWQSIMSFSGSNLDFFVHFDKYFDHPAVTYLNVNYRSCKSIVDTGSEIIKHNGNSQLNKKTSAKNKTMVPIKVYVSVHTSKFVDNYYTQIAQHCVSTIKEYLQNGYDPQDIMILSRIAKSPIMITKLKEYSTIQNIPISFETKSRNKIHFMSVHKSKGLQARVVFLLNVVEGLYGFPCERENPDIFEPATKGRKKDREEEERRLFYVAVTRAKEKLIIYTQKGSESNFLEEIQNHVIVENLQN
jgi:DNA helicase-4